MNDFETFLRWEARSRDTIDFKKAYVDMSGDVVAGLMLSQIVYWYLPSHDGDEKLRVERAGERWLVKSRDDWWSECRLSPREADRARKTLESLGIIEVKVYKFNGAPTQHIRILKNRFLELWQKALDEKSKDPQRKFSRGGGEEGGGQSMVGPKAERPKSLKSPFSRNGEMHFTNRGDGFHQNGEMDFTDRGKPKTETTTKTTSETTAAAKKATERVDAVADLVKELVSHDVGHAVAEQLASQKPEMCRRYLEYLPFAKPRKTAGAWLANAIRDEYGPPEGYLKAKSETKESPGGAAMARQTHQESLRRKKEAKLRSEYEAMEESNGEALIAFNRYIEDEKSRGTRVASVLSPKGKREFISAFDDRDRRLELFEKWVDLSRSADRKFRHVT